jgi:hypothetical protein
MKVVNNTNAIFKLPTGHEIGTKRSGTQLPKTILTHPDNVLYIEGLKRSRKISIPGAPAEEKRLGTTKQPGIEKHSREWFAVAERSDLIEASIELYGVSVEEGPKMTDDELREKLCRMKFQDF